METIGLIAGGGRFPILFAESARRAGYRVIAVGYKGETEETLADHVDSLTWVKLGQLGRTTTALKAGGASGTVMIGAIAKKRFFIDVIPDAVGLKLIAKVAVRSDDNVLRAIARHFESEGIPIVDPVPFLKDRLAPTGVFSKRRPNAEAMADAQYGLELARGIGRLDLGQTVVVKKGIALAVEALEGTDACIIRGGELGKEDTVVVKAVKPNQDRRFDLPAVGPDTIETMKRAKASVLAVEAGSTLVMDLKEMVRIADRAKIVLVGL